MWINVDQYHYEEGEDVDELLFSKDLSIFVYARSIPTFSYISPDDRIRVRAEESGVLLYPLFSQTIDQIEGREVSLYERYQQYFQTIR